MKVGHAESCNFLTDSCKISIKEHSFP